MSVSMEAIIFVFGVLLAVIGFFIVRTLDNVSDSVNAASKSVQELNVKMAIVVEQTKNHSEEIQKLKIQQLEMHNNIQNLNQVFRDS